MVVCCYGNCSRLKTSAMIDLSTMLTLFATSPTLMIPSSIQGVILFSVWVMLCGQMARIALLSAKTVERIVLFNAKTMARAAFFCTRTVSGYLAEERVLCNDRYCELYLYAGLGY